jgi:excisionase family DNA binding protein
VAEPWVSIDDVAEHLGVTKLSVYRWIDKQSLPATKVGKLWKLKLSEVEAWMRDHNGNSNGESKSRASDPDADRKAPRGVVLVVDDDEMVRASVAEFLEDQGYQVFVAGDGVEALKALEEAPKPDLILLDLKMPNLDGWAFREEQLRNPILAAVPVIVVTAVSKASLDGVTAVLCKPLRLPVLAKAIESLLEEP